MHAHVWPDTGSPVMMIIPWAIDDVDDHDDDNGWILRQKMSMSAMSNTSTERAI